MNRRDFVTLLGGTAAAWPLAARAQQAGAVRRVGVLMNWAANQPEGQAEMAAFMQALRQLGWNEGQNLRVDVRWNAGDTELAKIYGAQLIGLMPEEAALGVARDALLLPSLPALIEDRLKKNLGKRIP